MPSVSEGFGDLPVDLSDDRPRLSALGVFVGLWPFAVRLPVLGRPAIDAALRSSST